ncbi:MAG: hypothetical protein KAT43_02210 [Nanoarchaeota archaeon]|nr:hypothetical protein [Nanoarchaeota archaeon]
MTNKNESLDGYVIFLQQKPLPEGNIVGQRHPCLPASQDQTRAAVSGFIQGVRLLGQVFGDDYPPVYVGGKMGCENPEGVIDMSCEFLHWFEQVWKFPESVYDPEEWNPVAYAIKYDMKKTVPGHLREFERFLELYFNMVKIIDPPKKEEKDKSTLL